MRILLAFGALNHLNAFNCPADGAASSYSAQDHSVHVLENVHDFNHHAVTCNVLMLSFLTIKWYSGYKTREKGCMVMTVCERVSGNIIAFLLVSVRGTQLSLTVGLP